MQRKDLGLFILGVALIGAALFLIRQIAFDFRLGTTTEDHPYALFASALMAANFMALLLIPVIRNIARNGIHTTKLLWLSLFAGLAFRALFFGSTPIYEDDWNRYLWDGAVFAAGENPYTYSPDAILSGANNPDLLPLRSLSHQHPNALRRINNRQLSTIYPPVAIGVFSLAARIDPMNLDILRLLFLLTEALTFFLLVKALALYGRSPLWAALYALNPLIIYSGFNAAHMDVLLPPFILGALIAIRARPLIAGLALAGAAGVKIWPLLLAPVLYRKWLKSPKIYVAATALISILSLLLLWPMLQAPGDTSGLQAYSSQWERSSFIFPRLQSVMEMFSDNAGLITRLFIAVIIISVSLWFGFLSKSISDKNLPKHLLIVTLALIFLSPTGFPWYVTWALIFLPFVPSYGLALLACLVPLYYIRYALGEQGVYHIYTGWLIPLQFGLPLLVLAVECFRSQRRG